MVLKPDVVAAALAAAEDCPGPRIYLSPRGRLLDQVLVHDLAAAKGAAFFMWALRRSRSTGDRLGQYDGS